MLDNLPKSGMISEDMLTRAFQTEDIDGSGFLTRTQLYSLLIENGSDPLKKEEVDEMMEDCGIGDKFKYTGKLVLLCLLDFQLNAILTAKVINASTCLCFLAFSHQY